MNDLQILTKARALIARGWVQGQLSRFNNIEGRQSYCILGALVAAGGAIDIHNENHPLFRKLAACLRGFYPARACAASRLASFNDSRGRTKTEVLELIERAIAVELRKEQPSPAQCAMQRAFDTDLISHEETDHGFRPIRPISVFKLPEFNPKQEHEPDLHVSWYRRLIGSIRRQSEGISG